MKIQSVFSERFPYKYGLACQTTNGLIFRVQRAYKIEGTNNAYFISYLDSSRSNNMIRADIISSNQIALGVRIA